MDSVQSGAKVCNLVLKPDCSTVSWLTARNKFASIAVEEIYTQQLTLLLSLQSWMRNEVPEFRFLNLGSAELKSVTVVKLFN